MFESMATWSRGTSAALMKSARRPPSTVHAPIPVGQSADRGVVLVVAAHGLKDRSSFGDRYPLQLVHREPRFAACGFEPVLITGCGKDEPVGLPYPSVEVGFQARRTTDIECSTGTSWRCPFRTSRSVRSSDGRTSAARPSRMPRIESTASSP